MKRKKNYNISISRTTLYTQKIKINLYKQKNICLSAKINLRLEKHKNHIGGNFKIRLRHQKKR